ncbi:MAG: hypothetical protein OES18_15585, partial [Deltaproteobacteria bacterium]|nr:hypothetical protein [Deltaproteobacteria bacterium]
TLHTHAEEKRARVHQMWLRTGSVRTKRTSPYVRSWPRRAQPSRQRRDYGASLAILAGVGMQRLGNPRIGSDVRCGMFASFH